MIWEATVPPISSATISVRYRLGHLRAASFGKKEILGAGIGLGQQAARAAFGELIERRYFSAGSWREQMAPVGTLLEPRYESLRKALEQMRCSVGAIPQLEEQQIPWVSCSNLLGGPSVAVPSALVFHRDAGKLERAVVATSDSSACSYHQSLELALGNAYDEFTERQCMLAAWYGAKPEATWQLSRRDVAAIGDSDDSLNELVEHGELILADVSQGLGRYAVVAGFFSQAGYRGVKYSVGAAASCSPRIAARRALSELLLSMAFMESAWQEPEPLSGLTDAYQERFVAANHAETRDLLSFLSVDGSAMLAFRDWLRWKPHELWAALKEVRRFTGELLAYISGCPASGYFVKIFSPDFFLNIGDGHAVNLDNAFARKLGLSYRPRPDRLPFP